jgi:hypothetical protein
MCACRIGECVILEMRALGKPGGKAKAMEEYREKIKERQEFLEKVRQ